MQTMKRHHLILLVAAVVMSGAAIAAADSERDRNLETAAVHYRHALRSCDKEAPAARDACRARVKCYHDTAVKGLKDSSAKGPDTAVCLNKVQPSAPAPAARAPAPPARGVTTATPPPR